MTRISAPTPSSFSEDWISSATFFRSSLPWFVRISNVNGLPSRSRSPSPSVSFHPASASSARARAGSCGYRFTFPLYAQVSGL